MNGHIAAFATTTVGQRFFTAYDGLLSSWPSDTTTLDVVGRFGSTRVTATGPETAPPVVLVPGFGSSSMAWAGVARDLGVDHRVFALDFIGDIGRSVPDDVRMRTMDDVIEWFDHLLDAAGLSSPSVVAHSYGAMLSVAYALHRDDRVGRDDRVDRLVLMDPNACFAPTNPRYLVRSLPVVLRPTESRQERFLSWETDGVEFDDDLWTIMTVGPAHFPRRRPVVPRRPSTAQLSTLPHATTAVLAANSKVHDSERVSASITDRLPWVRVCLIPAATHHSLPTVPHDPCVAAIRDALTIESA
ncbi:alpha/beta hydrolase [Williamsia sterculiae]|uniref:Alpha/beta hydrolase fold n=1 Tax=Williamsia sterculiae TaxID=1344003 RepID=A0A1N7GAA9_9NOCA|nr:alpha/beta hydrolase family protein [Williamsia sterculiae]SIS09523.1 alpha/beta hydrolase fold [Williamsia sterculiae]